MKFCIRCGCEINSVELNEHEDSLICIKNLHQRIDHLEKISSLNPQKRNYVIKAWARCSKGLDYHGVCTISAYSREEALEEFKSKRWRFKFFPREEDFYNPMGSDCYSIDINPE